MSAPAGSAGAPGDDPVATSTTPEGEGEDTGGGDTSFGGLGAREASRRAVAARRARQAREEGTTAQKIAKAFDGLTQSDWDKAVRGALGNASGMQALVRLLDRVQGAGPEEAGEGDVVLTPEERQRILDTYAGRGGGEADPDPSLHDHAGGGNVGGEEAGGVMPSAGQAVSVGARASQAPPPPHARDSDAT